MNLVDAQPRDLDALHALVESAFRGDSARLGWSHEADLLDGQRTDIAELEAILADPAQALLMLRDDAGVAGCVSLTNKTGGLAYLGMLTVDPRRQASGLGRDILAAAERVAAERFEANRIELTIIPHRTELTAWYERRGYRLTGETRPFPADDPRFGLPKRDDLIFAVMQKLL
ncbi:MAG: GNAT family N-acetyltransferase [Sphingomonas bacterium]|nr:GNAT family N-acetyltransferase [Sphingomonas bacterium]